MSPANIKYLLAHNPSIPKDKVEIAPNSIDLIEPGAFDRENILRNYGYLQIVRFLFMEAIWASRRGYLS